MSELNPQQEPPAKEDTDIRVYLAQPDGWSAHVKQTGDREYCFQKNPGEVFFHLIMYGEIYVKRDEESYCLKCALSRGILSHDRLNWQKAGNPH